MTRDEVLSEAGKALDVFAPLVAGAALGNMVTPQLVGSFGLVLDYARLRLLQAALLDADISLAAALASPSSAVPAPLVGPSPAAAAGLIVPGS